MAFGDFAEGGRPTRFPGVQCGEELLVRNMVGMREVLSLICSRVRRALCHCILARTGNKSVLRLEIFLFCAMKSITHRLKM